MSWRNAKKLSWNERTVLEYLLWATNYSITKIAKILGYSRTTINNEIKNNSTFWGYFALDAIEKTITREKWKNHFKF
ncbi:helix-turn-helix domain-containing protein, partial [Mycoplasmopsis fermentans]|uniref:helix-turn-helix domain-containing protein n=1 Tax=Mycoplasmopsis fermentans TaxID=2115 RepID=UPI00059F8594